MFNRIGLACCMSIGGLLCSPMPNAPTGPLQEIEYGIEEVASEIKRLGKEAIDLAKNTQTILEEYQISVTARLSCEKPDKHSATTAYVATGPSSEEQSCLQNRKVRAEATLKSLLHKDIPTELLPTIAFCGSGGGNRAMFETLGWLSGAESLGLLDTILYVSGLSGSTWALNPWILSGLSLKEYKEQLVPRLTKSLSTQIQEMSIGDRYDLLTMLATTYYNNRQLRIVDLYGGLLSHIFLKGLPSLENPYEAPLSSLCTHISSGNFPYVISTCVVGSTPSIKETFGHNPSFEFTPHSCGSYELGCFIPTWSIGRPFSQGMSQPITTKSLFPELTILTDTAEVIAPQYDKYIEALKRLSSFFYDRGYYGHEVPLGYLIGICGSVFAADMYDILLELYELLHPGTIDPSKKEPLNILIKVIEDALENALGDLGQLISSGKLSKQDVITALEDQEFGAALIPNPSYGLSSSKLSSMKSFALVDGGLQNINLDSVNLGILSLLYRKADLIFICDSSSDTSQAQSLRAAEALARKLHLPFPQVNYDAIDSRFATLIVDKADDEAPIIVYMPTLRNPEYDKTVGRKIDPQNATYNTFNFLYTPEESNDLMNLVSYNVVQSKAVLLEALSLAVAKKEDRMKNMANSKKLDHH